MDIPRTLQDLPPDAARFCLGVERFMDRELGVRPEGVVLVGLSGGADSTALLLALRWLAPRLGCEVRAAHLDHGLRPESSDEAEAARDLCRSLDVPCVVERQDVAALAETQSLGLEEAARRARYAFLDRVRKDAGAAPGMSWIAVGHTLDDLAEDVVMRLVRGAGWPALGGMAGADPDRRLLRPLLQTPKNDIEAFLRGLDVAWTEDASNRDLAFLRNRLRHAVLPLLKLENPLFAKGVGRLWQQARQDSAWLTAELDALPWQEEPGGGLSLPLPALRKLPSALRLRACKHALERLGPGQPLADNLFALDEAVMSGAGGKTVQFPGSKIVKIGGGTVRFLPAGNKNR